MPEGLLDHFDVVNLRKATEAIDMPFMKIHLDEKNVLDSGFTGIFTRVKGSTRPNRLSIDSFPSAVAMYIWCYACAGGDARTIPPKSCPTICVFWLKAHFLRNYLVASYFLPTKTNTIIDPKIRIRDIH